MNDSSRTSLGRLLVVAATAAAAAVLMTVSPARAAGPDAFEAKLTASDAGVGDAFGRSVAVSGDVLVVGSPSDSASGPFSGAAYVFVRDGKTWSQQAKLRAADAAGGAQFGRDVAVSGNTIVVGAHFGSDLVSVSGSAYVFIRNGSTWSQQAKLNASDPSVFDEFGISVAISGDTVVVGAFGSGDNSGAGYVFVRSGSTWSQQAKLNASDAAASDDFGFSVAISGNTIVVGAPGDDDGGSAYVFTRDRNNLTLGKIWVEQSKLVAADGALDDLFGGSVAISGSTVVVGAASHDDAGSASGAAYVFVPSRIRFGLGSDWKQQAKLTASDAAKRDLFGTSVSVSGDMIVVGALRGDTSDVDRDSGAAYVFAREGTAWSEQTKLTAPDAASGDLFGISVAIAGDWLVAGARGDDDAGEGSGSAYVFVDTLSDSDDDGLSDFEERNTFGTDPSEADTDGDGVSDGDEVAAGTDPLKPPPTPPAVVVSGYWMLELDGTLYEFGDSAAFGPAAVGAGVTAVAFDRTAAGDGLWVLDSTGKVHVRGAAKNLGDVDLGALAVGDKVASISATPTGLGYWVFTDLGQVLTFGDAQHFDDLPGLGITPNGLVVASAPTPSGNGYYMLGADGGVFAFGDAIFVGSIPEVLAPGALACAIVGLVPTPSGDGYWMVACDGGVFAFGDASFVGSIPGVLAKGTQLNSPINGLVPYGNGYLMVASDGGVFTFSDLAFLGSLGANPPDTPIVAITAFVS